MKVDEVDEKIWRYMDLIKFFSLLNGQFFFARADLFKDQFEGAVPPKVVDDYVEWMCAPPGTSSEDKIEIRDEWIKKFKEKNKKVAINCWHLSDHESTNMWDSYTKNGLGVVIRSSIGKISNIGIPEGYNLKHYPVNYIDFDEENDPMYINYELIPFMNKRKQYWAEKEYRFMIYKDKSIECINQMNTQMIEKLNFGQPLKPAEIIDKMYISKVQTLTDNGVNVKVDPSLIIEKIIAHPDMKAYEIEELQKVLDKYNSELGMSLIIKQSSLTDSPY